MKSEIKLFDFNLNTDRSIQVDLNEECLDRRKENRKLVGLCIKDQEKYLKWYFEIVKEQNIPVVFNPGIPYEVIKTMAETLKLSKLLFDDEELLIDHDSYQETIPSHMVCTSGTTSKKSIPKNFMFNLEKVIKNAKAHYQSYQYNGKIETVLFPMPLYHSFGVVVGLWGSLLAERNLLLIKDPVGAEQIIKILNSENVDILYLTPSLARNFIKYKRLQKKIIKTPKIISIGSSSIYKDEVISLMNIFKGTKIYYTYGLTEMGPRVSTFACGSYEHMNMDSEIGGLKELPLGDFLPGIEYKIEDNKLLLQSVYSSNDLNPGYFNTSDICIEDNKGCLYIKGRSDNTIISSGINIFPEEVEQIIYSNFNIKNCCLVGIPNKLYGDQGILAIDTELPKDQVFSTLKDSLPASHIPKDIIYIKDFPQNSMNKIERSKVREIVINRLVK